MWGFNGGGILCVKFLVYFVFLLKFCYKTKSTISNLIYYKRDQLASGGTLYSECNKLMLYNLFM